MISRIGRCTFMVLHCVTLGDRVEEIDIDADMVAIMQLHSNTLGYHQQPPPAVDVASLAVPAAQEIVDLGLTPDQVATSIASAIVSGAGLDQSQAHDLISRIDVPALAEGLADVFGDYSAEGDLAGEVDVSVRFDPVAALHVITTWLDNVAIVFADEGLSTLSTSSLLTAWLANPGPQNVAKSGQVQVALLATAGATVSSGEHEDGYDHVMTNFAKGIADAANGTYTVQHGNEGGPIEVKMRVNGVGLMGAFSSWLGDLAASFEEVGVRDAFIRAGLGPEEEEATREERQHLIVSLLGQKGRLSASSSSAARDAREQAVNMMRTMLNQRLQHSQAREASHDATGAEKSE